MPRETSPSDEDWSWSPPRRTAQPPRILLVWCSFATGALLAGGTMLAVIGHLGRTLNLIGAILPTVPAWLFEYPLAVPGVLAGGATAGVIGAGLFLPRRWGLSLSVVCGVVGLCALGVVAVSSLGAIDMVLSALIAHRPAVL